MELMLSTSSLSFHFLPLRKWNGIGWGFLSPLFFCLSSINPQSRTQNYFL
jgi:hypothetical protein